MKGDVGIGYQTAPHQPELDGIRGLAILGVLLSHGVGLSGLFRLTPQSSVIENFFAYFLVPLWGGVDLFFVLSGFLITGILLRTNARPGYFKSFYVRRVLRIFPIYYLALLLSLVAACFSHVFAAQLPPSIPWKIAYLFYLQNWPVFWHGAKLMEGIWGAYWSLAVEEQFYFLWPLLVFSCSEKMLTLICVIGFCLSLPLRLLLAHVYFADSFGLDQTTPCRFDGLLIGAYIALYCFKWKSPPPKKWIKFSAVVGLLILAYIGLAHPTEFVGTGIWITTVGVTAFVLLSGSIVAASQHHPRVVQRVLGQRWLRSLGKYSYGLYVYHLLVFLPVRWALLSGSSFLIHLSFLHKVGFLTIEILVVYGIARLSYDHFEVRFLALKERFSPR